MSAQVEEGVVIPEWSFSDRLRKARLTVGMDQREFAQAIDVSHPALGQWETGRGRPRDLVAVAKRIELLTRVPASWLLDISSPGPGGTDSHSKPNQVSKGRSSL